MNEDRILRLEKKVRRQQTIMVVLFAAMIGAATMAFDLAGDPSEEIRTKKITILTEDGLPVAFLKSGSGRGLLAFVSPADSTDIHAMIGAAKTGGYCMLNNIIGGAAFSAFVSNDHDGVLMLQNLTEDVTFMAPTE